jgi:hypothetical protein
MSADSSVPPAAAPPFQAPADAVVAMAPIPNPGDPGSAAYYPTAAPPPAVRFHRRAEPTSSTEQASATRSPAGAPFVRSRRAERARAAKMLQAQPRRAAAAASSVSRPTSAAPLASGRQAPPPARSAAPNSAAPAVSGLSAFQAQLTARIHASAALTTPNDPLVGRPFEATLTLPDGFAEALRAEAQKDGFGSEAVSATLSATLAGAGYAVMPAEVQTTPLVGGQAVAFHWTVTRLGQGRGPLQASVSGALLGGSTTPFTLGTVQKDFGAGSAVTPRVVGVTLLVLIGALVAAWLGRSRRRSRPSEVRRSDPKRPLDMTGEGPTL